MNQVPEGVHVITDTYIQDRFDHVELAKYAGEAGVSVIQFRDKKLVPGEMLPVIRNMKECCKQYKSQLLVNDRVDLAMMADVNGVHLGQDDLPIERVRELVGEDKYIGGSASNMEEALDVEEKGADYVGFGHIFQTTTKQKGYEPRGLENLERVATKLNIPLIAIGGITLENAEKVMQAGANGFAVGSAVCASDDPEKAARQLVEIYERFR